MTTINSWNAQAFGLQNASVAALVERHTFALVDQVIPGFNLVEGTETFRYGRLVYPMKQPGQTIMGSLVYWPLYHVGFTFANHFDYVSHLITIGTSTILTAGAAVLVFLFGFKLTNNRKASFVGALLFVFGTLVWPYAGVTHHDILGMSIGLAAVTSFSVALASRARAMYFLAGALATLTLFFTMLPLTLPIVISLVSLRFDRYSHTLWLALGLTLGILPTLAFNYLIFGNPWLPPNIAGQVSDTMPLLSLPNLVEKLWFYLGAPSTSLWAFAPILLFGLLGILSLQNRVFKTLLLALPLAQLLHISSMETFGGYQYGPRYLLSVIPYLALGIPVWLTKAHAPIARFVFALCVLYSVGVAALGATQTVMYPVPGPYAPLAFVTQILLGKWPTFRMLRPGFLLILFTGVWWYTKQSKYPQQRH